MNFAKKMEKKSLLHWKNYIFSDESSLTQANPNGRTFVRRGSGDVDYSNKNNVQQNYTSSSLMVWGAISIEGVGPLVRIDKLVEGEVTLNGQRYLLLLQRHLLQNYPDLKDGEGIFQQDNAPCHRYWEVLDWLEFKNINISNEEDKKIPPKRHSLSQIFYFDVNGLYAHIMANCSSRRVRRKIICEKVFSHFGAHDSEKTKSEILSGFEHFEFLRG